GIDGNFPSSGILAGRLQRGGGMHYSQSRGKECPGSDRIKQVPQIFARAEAILGGATTTPTQEEPEMDATQAKQLSDVHKDTGEIETIVRQLRTKVDRSEARIVALTATVEAMAANIGADAQAITAAVSKSVDKALADLTITLKAEG